MRPDRHRRRSNRRSLPSIDCATRRRRRCSGGGARRAPSTRRATRRRRAGSPSARATATCGLRGISRGSLYPHRAAARRPRVRGWDARAPRARSLRRLWPQRGRLRAQRRPRPQTKSARPWGPWAKRRPSCCTSATLILSASSNRGSARCGRSWRRTRRTRRRCPMRRQSRCYQRSVRRRERCRASAAAAAARAVARSISLQRRWTVRSGSSLHAGSSRGASSNTLAKSTMWARSWRRAARTARCC
mmetsp:Transcript_34974/g.91685  ORF Transcript_34974/g.91685 Transcript_34974/m.91685 type:complete len:246 (+) Transcript_34974:474-1211(+)